LLVAGLDARLHHAGWGISATLNKTGWEESGAARTLLCALVPAIVTLLVHINYISNPQLQFNFTVGRIRHNATESVEKQLHQLPEQTYVFIRDAAILQTKVSVRLEILTVMLLRIQVFLGVTLCRWVGGALKGHVHLHFQCQAVHEECLAKQHSV
jgi:hypothetical protein